jgi:hypothetical protein
VYPELARHLVEGRLADEQGHHGLLAFLHGAATSARPSIGLGGRSRDGAADAGLRMVCQFPRSCSVLISHGAI